MLKRYTPGVLCYVPTDRSARCRRQSRATSARPPIRIQDVFAVVSRRGRPRAPLASAVGLSRTCALGRYVLVSERVAGVDARGDVAVRTTLGAVVIDRPHQLRSAPGAFLHAAADVGASGQPLRDLFLLRYLSSVPEVHPAALAQVPVHAGFRRNRYTVDRGVSRSHEKAGALKRSQS